MTQKEAGQITIKCLPTSCATIIIMNNHKKIRKRKLYSSIAEIAKDYDTWEDAIADVRKYEKRKKRKFVDRFSRF